MKAVLKLACAKALLFLMTTSAAAVTQPAGFVLNQQASTYFTDASGNVGAMDVFRQTDPVTKVTTTSLVYSFCIQTTAASCLEGAGFIPNGDFTGAFGAYPWRADTMNLTADTNIAGFDNHLCNGPFGGECASRTPATGGLLSLRFTSITGTEEDFIFYDWHLVNFKLVLDTKNKTSQGPASAVGTVIGINVNNKGASWGAEVLSGLGAPSAQVQLAKSHLSLINSLPPHVAQRLNKLKGITMQ